MMLHARLDNEDQAKPLGGSVVIACPVHEPAVMRAVAGGGDVDDATLREVDEAMECPACRLLLALASGDASFVEPRVADAGADPRQKVVPFPAPSGSTAGARNMRP